MAYNSSNEANIVRQELYDATLEKALDDWLVGRPLFDDKTGMFPDGDTLNITKTGDRATYDYTEDSAITFDNMQTSRVDLSVTEYKADGFYITDKLKQDGHQAEAFWAENVRKSAIAQERVMEQDVLAVANQQTLGNANTINGRAHRFQGSGTGGALTIEDIGGIKLAFDKALVPTENRVLIITPEMEFELNKLLNMTEVTNGGSTFNYNVDGMVQTGFGDRLNITKSIFGINLMVSHNLPDVTAETLAHYDGTGSGSITGKACIAMSMADASSMPFMGVIRQRPQSEFFRNTHYKRDEWSATCRYGFGLKRAESLIVVATPV